MSISSMLGSSDADRPPRERNSVSSIFSRPPTSSTPSLFGAPPPPHSTRSPPPLPVSSPLDFPLFHRPPSHPFSEGPKYDALSRSLSSSQYPERPPAARIPTEPPYRGASSGAIPRPSSQPQYAEPSFGGMPGYSPLSRQSTQVERSPSSSTQRTTSLMGEPNRFGPLFADGQREREIDRERTLSRESDLKPFRFGSQHADRETSSWSQPPPSPESKRFTPEPSTGAFGFGDYAKSRPPPPPSFPSEQGMQSHTRLWSTPDHHHVPFEMSTFNDGRRKGSEELMQHRSLLGVGLDGKRGGRASPLPQAVQGAQGQILGRTEAMNNELGRVFSGIGSGVGGASASASGSGLTAPMSASPFKRESIMGRSSVMGEDEGARIRRDEDGQLDGDNLGPRSSISSRGRSGHLNHHHHH